MTRHFDSIVIEAGQAGSFPAARSVSNGERVALIEQEQSDGTCVNVGCAPTKALVANARATQHTRRGAASVRPSTAAGWWGRIFRHHF